MTPEQMVSKLRTYVTKTQQRPHVSVDLGPEDALEPAGIHSCIKCRRWGPGSCGEPCEVCHSQIYMTGGRWWHRYYNPKHAARPLRSRLTVLSLFAGIGGLELGLERAGMHVVGQVELDPYCRRVLARHWPEVPRHDDVRTASNWWQSGDRPRVDVVCGGFPCQPFSTLGLKRGTGDERWGWPWMADVIRAVRPRYVVVENVAALIRDRDAFGWMLGDLADLGFDAEWSLLSACTVGAPHTRERLFLVAHPKGGDGEQPVHLPAAVETGRAGDRAARGDAGSDRWLPEPDVGRVADGFPKRLVAPDLHALGNAVVPQVAELVGRRIVAMDKAVAA